MVKACYCKSLLRRHHRKVGSPEPIGQFHGDVPHHDHSQVRLALRQIVERGPLNDQQNARLAGDRDGPRAAPSRKASPAVIVPSR